MLPSQLAVIQIGIENGSYFDKSDLKTFKELLSSNVVRGLRTEIDWYLLKNLPGMIRLVAHSVALLENESISFADRLRQCDTDIADIKILSGIACEMKGETSKLYQNMYKMMLKDLRYRIQAVYNCVIEVQDEQKNLRNAFGDILESYQDYIISSLNSNRAPHDCTMYKFCVEISSDYSFSVPTVFQHEALQTHRSTEALATVIAQCASLCFDGKIISAGIG